MTTHKEKIAEIRRICIASNSEIVELKFGCLVKTKESPRPQLVAYKYPLSPDGSQTVRTEYNESIVVTQDEIIGRDIRIADVLLATGWKFNINYCDVDIMGSEGVCLYDLLSEWNLLKDSLEDQSEECISFLHGLLADEKSS